MKPYRYIISAALVLALAACGGKKDASEETNETSEEIEAAFNAGREMAKSFATREWDDTLRLQRHLLEVRAEQSKYVMAGKKRSAEAFDSAFVSAMKTVRPDLNAHLEATRK